MTAVEDKPRMLSREAALQVRSFAGLPASKLRPIVESVVCDPYIAERVRHDHRAPGFIQHPDVTYYGAYVGGDLVGVYCVIATGFIEVELHAFLGRTAHVHCRDLARQMFALIFADPEVNRITAPILEGLDSVRNHCARLGFQVEGFRRGAYMKDGKVIGVHMLGLTRADWEALQ